MPEPFDVSNRALLISNPASGANRKLGLESVRASADAARLPHRCVDDIDALDGVLAEAAGRGDRLIIINGGDGTVCRVLQILREHALFTTEPTLALLRGGTTNMIHNDVGIPGKPDAALPTLLDGLARGAFDHSERHVLRVARSPEQASVYGFFFGTNAVARAILQTRERFHRRGFTGGVSQIMSITAIVWRLMRRRVQADPVLAPVALEMRRDDSGWYHDEHILLMAMSVKRAILGIKPLQHGQPAGLATLSWPDYRLLAWLLRFIRGTLEEFDAVSLRGRFDWILDGETYQHHASDGVLSVSVDTPARFLAMRRRSPA